MYGQPTECTVATLDPVYDLLAFLATVGFTIFFHSLFLLALAWLMCSAFTLDRVLQLAARGRHALRL